MKSRRSRSGETSGAFKMAAPRMTRRSATRAIIFHAADLVWDTLHWLHLWDENDPLNTMDSCDDFLHRGQDDFSLHL